MQPFKNAEGSPLLSGDGLHSRNGVVQDVDSLFCGEIPFSVKVLKREVAIRAPAIPCPMVSVVVAIAILPDVRGFW